MSVGTRRQRRCKRSRETNAGEWNCVWCLPADMRANGAVCTGVQLLWPVRRPGMVPVPVDRDQVDVRDVRVVQRLQPSARVLLFCCTPLLQLAGVSTGMQRGRQQSGTTLAAGSQRPEVSHGLAHGLLDAHTHLHVCNNREPTCVYFLFGERCLYLQTSMSGVT